MLRKKEIPPKFPYEVLVQIYNQRVQILWFTIAIAMAFLGAFYIALTDPYYGDNGLVSIFIMLFGFILTINLFFMECRNYAILKSNEKKMGLYLKVFNSSLAEICSNNISEGSHEGVKTSDLLDLSFKGVYPFKIGELINVMFALLFFIEGMSIISIMYVSKLSFLNCNSFWSGIILMTILFFSSILLLIIIPRRVLHYELCEMDDDKGYIKYKADLVKRINIFRIFFFIMIPVIFGAGSSFLFVKGKVKPPRTASEMFVNLSDDSKENIPEEIRLIYDIGKDLTAINDILRTFSEGVRVELGEDLEGINSRNEELEIRLKKIEDLLEKMGENVIGENVRKDQKPSGG